MKKAVEIYKVLRLTPGGNNAWVETNVGVIKKPLKAIPQKLLDEYEGEQEKI